MKKYLLFLILLSTGITYPESSWLQRFNAAGYFTRLKMIYAPLEPTAKEEIKEEIQNIKKNYRPILLSDGKKELKIIKPLMALTGLYLGGVLSAALFSPLLCFNCNTGVDYLKRLQIANNVSITQADQVWGAGSLGGVFLRGQQGRIANDIGYYTKARRNWAILSILGWGATIISFYAFNRFYHKYKTAFETWDKIELLESAYHMSDFERKIMGFFLRS